MGRSILRIIVVSGLMLVVYALVPVASRGGASAIVRMCLGLVIYLGVVVWQIRSIRVAHYPLLRAAEALAAAFVLLVLGLAFVYLSMSAAHPANFSEPLDRVGAAYFTLSVITTVGFGDIAARTDAARVVVSIQFILDLLLIFGVVRLFRGTVQATYGQRQDRD